MKIPRYWAKAEKPAKGRTGEVFYFIKWGWSDRSPDDAGHMARRAVEEIAARIASGGEFPEHYGYGDGRPMREEVVRTMGRSGADDEAVITRNSYGSLILNTARVMFIDVDLQDWDQGGSSGRGEKSSGGIGGLMGKLFGSRRATPPTAPADSPPQPTPNEQAAIDQAQAWTNSHRSWGFRIYRTAAGLRLLATHDLFDPKDRAVTDVMEALGADPLYLRLCRAQECFRARLTPKPWRIGIHPPHIYYPSEGAHQDKALRQWLAKYDQACARAATCQLLTTLGSNRVMEPVAAMIRLHDDETRTSMAGHLKLA